MQVKRVLVVQRENPIVNRLNKTKVEKKPDLRQEKEDRQKELRKKDQATQLQKVCSTILTSQLSPPLTTACLQCFRGLTIGCVFCFCRRRKKQIRLENGKRKSGKRIMRMMNSLRRIIWLRRVTRIEILIGRMISCSQFTPET